MAEKLREKTIEFASDFIDSVVNEVGTSTDGEEVAKSLQEAWHSVKGAHYAPLEIQAERVRKLCWERLNQGGWPNVGWREAYIFSLLFLTLCLVEKISSLPKESTDIISHLKTALNHLDMALIMGGLSCGVVHEMINVVEPALMEYLKGREVATSANHLPESSWTIMSEAPSWTPKIPQERAVRREVNPPCDRFKKEFYKTNTPVVLEGIIQEWPAMQRWQNLNYLNTEYGHRTVPVEVGQLEDGKKKDGWKEEAMYMSELIDKYLRPSNVDCQQKSANLDQDAPDGRNGVAYLAQHGLFDQIPALGRDLAPPAHATACVRQLEGINAWLGTAGTVTPLHHDSYDNLLAQAVGYKYVRLYDRGQTPLLYVGRAPRGGGGGAEGGSKTDYGAIGAQGNVSPIRVEPGPDPELHPLAAQAVYTETVLGPGDVLFIPAKHWHYVRSLTPSFSVNFWF